MNRYVAQAALFVRQGALDDGLDLLPAERLEGEDLAAAEERRVDREEWVLRRGTDQDNPAFLNIRQQDILLCPVEAMNLVHEENGALTAVLQLGPRLFQQLTQFL